MAQQLQSIAALVVMVLFFSPEDAQAAVSNRQPLAVVPPPCVGPPASISSVVADCSVGQIVVTFSRQMDFATATAPGNYNITGGLVTLNGLAMDPNGNRVTLLVSGLASDINYTLTASNVRDRCANTLFPNPTSVPFSCPSCDTTPPVVTSASVDCANSRILVTFSEPTDPAFASNVANYSLSPGLPIFAAIPEPSGILVTLNVGGLNTNIAYTLMLANIRDRCANLLAPNPTSVSISCQACDVTPPVVTSVFGDCAGNRVVIRFSKPMNFSTAAAITNYNISSGPTVVSANPDASGSNVTLSVAGLAAGITYTLRVSGVQDRCTNTLSPNPTSLLFSCQTCDTTPPFIAAVFGDCASNRVVVTFSEPLNLATTSVSSNFNISPGAMVVSASPDSSGSNVILGVAGLLGGTSYTLSVANARDLCTNTLSPNPTFAVFSCQTCETTPPSITSVAPDCAGNRVAITFSEAMDSSALDVFNYTIDPGVTILSVSFAGYNNTVTLNVSYLNAHDTYTLTVRNVRDLCANDLSPYPFTRPFSCSLVPPADVSGSWPPAVNQSCAYKADLQPYIILKSLFTVSNAGPGTAKASIVKFFLSDDDVLDANDPMIQKQVCRKLGVHQERQIQFRGTLPICTPATNKFVIAVVNATQRVPESYTNNNQAIFGPIP